MDTGGGADSSQWQFQSRVRGRQSGILPQGMEIKANKQRQARLNVIMDQIKGFSLVISGQGNTNGNAGVVLSTSQQKGSWLKSLFV